MFLFFQGHLIQYISSKHLPVQSQQQKHQTVVQNMSEVLVSLSLTFTPFSTVSIVDFEQVFVFCVSIVITTLLNDSTPSFNEFMTQVRILLQMCRKLEWWQPVTMVSGSQHPRHIQNLVKRRSWSVWRKQLTAFIY